MVSSKKILLVDDDLDDQEIFRIVLGELSRAIDCSYADTAEDALSILLKKADPLPDYVFLDLNLPYMSGFECLNAIKADTTLQNIPVIIYSTSSREADKRKAKELGAQNYVSKPSTIGELKAILTDIFA